MTVVGFIAAQRTEHGVGHTVACRALGVSVSWFYKWRNRRSPGELGGGSSWWMPLSAYELTYRGRYDLTSRVSGVSRSLSK